MKDDKGDCGRRDDKGDGGSRVMAAGGGGRRRSMVSWARSGAVFVGCGGEIGGSGGSAGGGVFFLIDVSKTTNLGGTSGTQNVRFCDLRICGSLVPKNGWMIRKFTIHNSQTRKSGTPDYPYGRMYAPAFLTSFPIFVL
jgi:hypothetical protein